METPKKKASQSKKGATPILVKNKKGRPHAITPEVADKIFKRLAEGETLLAICADADMPSRETVRKQILSDADFFANYARARELQAEGWEDEMLKLIDSLPPDSKNANYSSAAKLKVDTMKWIMAKRLPKKYGDKLDITSKGDKIITAVQVNYVFPEGWQPPELKQ